MSAEPRTVAAVARARALAHVAYEAPDLALMERFLTDFGLVRAVADDQVLYMRGTCDQHHLHVTRRAASARFVGAAFEVSSRAHLHALARLPGSSPVQPNPEPGGGWRVCMRMPDGFDIQALWGRTRVLALNQRMPNEFNAGVRKRRVARALRVARGPGPAMRLGHFVLHVSNHDESVDWLRERFGLLESDHFLPPGSDGPVVGTFLRLDAGSRLVDHHCLLVLQSQSPGVHHVSFEMQDLDDVMASHDHLAARGWRLDCGVGRHLLGSQIFDYWRDPFGFRVEHYTDGDVVDASHRPGRFNGTAGDTTQWGAMPPAEFFA